MSRLQGEGVLPGIAYPESVSAKLGECLPERNRLHENRGAESCFKQANQTDRGPFKRIGRNDEFVYQYCVRNRNI